MVSPELSIPSPLVARGAQSARWNSLVPGSGVITPTTICRITATSFDKRNPSPFGRDATSPSSPCGVGVGVGGGTVPPPQKPLPSEKLPPVEVAPASDSAIVPSSRKTSPVDRPPPPAITLFWMTNVPPDCASVNTVINKVSKDATATEFFILSPFLSAIHTNGSIPFTCHLLRLRTRGR